MRTHFAPILALAAAMPVTAQEKRPLTEQQARGHDLFLHSQKGAACKTCHMLASEGVPIGPDLTNLGGAATPAGMRVAILSTQTVYVQTVKLAKGDSFPAMKNRDDGKFVEYYDLREVPPILRRIRQADVETTTNNTQWKHPPESAGYTDAELADVISYIRYVAKGENKTVKLN